MEPLIEDYDEMQQKSEAPDPEPPEAPTDPERNEEEELTEEQVFGDVTVNKVQPLLTIVARVEKKLKEANKVYAAWQEKTLPNKHRLGPFEYDIKMREAIHNIMVGFRSVESDMYDFKTRLQIIQEEIRNK